MGTTTPDQNADAPKHAWRSFQQIVLFGLLASVGLFAPSVFPTFTVSSLSMAPTVMPGDMLFVSRIAQLATGDVVAFVAPAHVGINAGQTWVARMIAGPGDRVRIENHVVIVDGQPYDHVGEPERIEYEGPSPVGSHTQATHRVSERIGGQAHDIFLDRPDEPKAWPPSGVRLVGLQCGDDTCVVEEGHIFVMGDNRDNSHDGRRWGAVPRELVVGPVVATWSAFRRSRPKGEPPR